MPSTRCFSINWHLSRYELGTSVPPADAPKQLADALQVSWYILPTDHVATVKEMELLRKFELRLITLRVELLLG